MLAHSDCCNDEVIDKILLPRHNGSWHICHTWSQRNISDKVRGRVSNVHWTRTSTRFGRIVMSNWYLDSKMADSARSPLAFNCRCANNSLDRRIPCVRIVFMVETLLLDTLAHTNLGLRQ